MVEQEWIDRWNKRDERISKMMARIEAAFEAIRQQQNCVWSSSNGAANSPNGDASESVTSVVTPSCIDDLNTNAVVNYVIGRVDVPPLDNEEEDTELQSQLLTGNEAISDSVTDLNSGSIEDNTALSTSFLQARKATESASIKTLHDAHSVFDEMPLRHRVLKTDLPHQCRDVVTRVDVSLLHDHPYDPGPLMSTFTIMAVMKQWGSLQLKSNWHTQNESSRHFRHLFVKMSSISDFHNACSEQMYMFLREDNNITGDTLKVECEDRSAARFWSGAAGMGPDSKLRDYVKRLKSLSQFACRDSKIGLMCAAKFWSCGICNPHCCATLRFPAANCHVFAEMPQRIRVSRSSFPRKIRYVVTKLRVLDPSARLTPPEPPNQNCCSETPAAWTQNWVQLGMVATTLGNRTDSEQDTKHVTSNLGKGTSDTTPGGVDLLSAKHHGIALQFEVFYFPASANVLNQENEKALLSYDAYLSQLHAKIVVLSFDQLNSFTINILWNIYSKLNLLRDAHKLFAMLPLKKQLLSSGGETLRKCILTIVNQAWMHLGGLNQACVYLFVLNFLKALLRGVLDLCFGLRKVATLFPMVQGHSYLHVGIVVFEIIGLFELLLAAGCMYVQVVVMCIPFESIGWTSLLNMYNDAASNVLTDGSKNVISACLTFWRMLLLIKQRDESIGISEVHAKQMGEFKQRVALEFSNTCTVVMRIIPGAIIFRFNFYEYFKYVGSNQGASLFLASTIHHWKQSVIVLFSDTSICGKYSLFALWRSKLGVTKAVSIVYNMHTICSFAEENEYPLYHHEKFHEVAQVMLLPMGNNKIHIIVSGTNDIPLAMIPKDPMISIGAIINDYEGNGSINTLTSVAHFEPMEKYILLYTVAIVSMRPAPLSLVLETTLGIFRNADYSFQPIEGDKTVLIQQVAAALSKQFYYTSYYVGIKQQTILPTDHKTWDPGDVGCFTHTKGSIPFKQWEPGGYFLVYEESTLSLKVTWRVASFTKDPYRGFNFEDNSCFAHTKGLVQIRQWDPGGCSLIYWEGTLQLKATWKETTSTQKHFPNSNLEDKVDFNRGGNVMIQLARISGNRRSKMGGCEERRGVYNKMMANERAWMNIVM